MKKVQKTYTAELKREAVRFAQTSGKPIAQVDRELGISDTSIHHWRKDLTFPRFGGSAAPSVLDATPDRMAFYRWSCRFARP